jgi:predicted Fe-Mo cluster-binding NifX family protein
MKIAITAVSGDMNSQLEQKFGRAEFFIIADTTSEEFVTIDNKAAMEAGGAGIQAGQTIIDSGAVALITGNVGPNAMRVLQSGKVKMFRGQRTSIKENIELYKENKLEEIIDSVSAHHGMN